MRRIAYLLFIVLIVALTGCVSKPVDKTVRVSEPITATIEEKSVVDDSAGSIPTIHEIMVQGKAFRPSKLEINQGDTVVFRTIDDNNHTIIFYENEEYTGEILSQDDVYEITLDDEPGVYKYRDEETGGTGLIQIN